VQNLGQFHRRLVDQGPKNPLEKLLLYLLIPLSVLYGLLMWARSILYRAGVLSVTNSRIPVISVGNLSAGGTGKTPFVDYLLSYFEQKGFRPAVVSRGYGGRFSGRLAIVSDVKKAAPDASYYGDESCLLACKHPQALVVIAPKRRDAINWINTEKKADVIILDDAFQHLQAGRDLDIVLLDAARPFGNNYLLPAGLLREFPAALKRADLLVLTRAKTADKKLTFENTPTVSCAHQIAEQLKSLDGEVVNTEDIAGMRGAAFAGIAGPEAFFKGLVGMGLDLYDTCSFSDHQHYNPELLAQLSELKDRVDYYVTTEKDAVKISALDLPRPCYVAQLKIVLLEDSEMEVRKTLETICDRINDEQ